MKLGPGMFIVWRLTLLAPLNILFGREGIASTEIYFYIISSQMEINP